MVNRGSGAHERCSVRQDLESEMNGWHRDQDDARSSQDRNSAAGAEDGRVFELILLPYEAERVSAIQSRLKTTRLSYWGQKATNNVRATLVGLGGLGAGASSGALPGPPYEPVVKCCVVAIQGCDSRV